MPIKPQENLTMKKTLSSLTVAVIAAFAAQGAMAQAASAPTRADVKKETAAANKAGAIPGTGTGQPAAAMGETSPKEKAATSTTTRDARKATTAEANKAGDIPGTGVSNVPAAAAGQQSPKEQAATSTTTREDRKKATAEANKAGTIPQGEAAMQSPKK
jgi:glucokinase